MKKSVVSVLLALLFILSSCSQALTSSGVPVTTTLAGFAEAIKGISAVAQAPAETPLSLQEWHARGLA